MEIINHKNKHYIKTKTGFKEVLACTDISLKLRNYSSFNSCCKEKKECHCNLPKIPQAFIDYYITKYNNGNIIDFCEIEYEYYYVPQQDSEIDLEYHKIKVNSSNYINIKQLKDNWNKEEILSIYNKMREKRNILRDLFEKQSFIEAGKTKLKINGSDWMLSEFDKWIENNS